MKIAVLSGKGGTGKTFISANLAEVMKSSTYVDCDVEEPNGHLFFQPVWTKTERVYRKLPVVKQEQCTGCRICSDFCKFNALAYVGEKILVFDEVCHSCGGCSLFCPLDAIEEKEVEVGMIQKGKSLKTNVYTGTMLTKEASGIPIITKLLHEIKEVENVIIDCPPGSACSVMESIKEADYCILVAEPTLFGKHNLAMVHELVQLYKKPYGVILNKSVEGINPSRVYCEEHNIPIIKEIFYDEKVAIMQSEGKMATRSSLLYWNIFHDLLEEIEEVYDEAVVSA